MKQFLDKHKVFILGLLGSVALALQPFINNASDEIKWKSVGFAALMAVLSYLAKEWRGQAISIVGIIGNLAGVYVTIQQTGAFSWTQFIMQGLVAIIAAVTADAKSRGYEQATVIKQAKIEGEVSNPSSLTNMDVKKKANEIIKNQ